MTLTRLVAGPAEYLRRDRPLTPTALAGLGGAAVLAIAVSAALPERGAVRAALAIVLAGLLGFVCLRSARQGILVTLGWLAVVGGLRRVVTTFQADPTRDPLLLVGPVAVTILVVVALASGALGRRSLLANGTLVLTAVMTLWSLHPDQGPVRVGLGGLLFWGVPMLWFWVGRGLVDTVLARRVLVVTAVVAAGASLYGLFQVLVRFPSWDWRYIFGRGSSQSLYVGPGTYRPFAAFASANEYALCTACGIVLFTLVAARGVRAHRRGEAVVGIVGVGLTGAALALSSVRAPMVLVAVALATLAVVRLRKAAIPLLLGGIAVVVLVGAVFSQIDPDSLARTGPEGMVRRAVVGLGHPFDGDRSTLNLHLDALVDGVEEAFEDPLGDGTGSTTTAALRLGGDRSGTEWDVSDGGVAFGILGLVLVAAVTVAAFVRVGRSAWRNPDLLHLAVLGFMIVLFRHWWNGGHYFLAPMLWVLVGALDARAARPVGGARP